MQGLIGTRDDKYNRGGETGFGEGVSSLRWYLNGHLVGNTRCATGSKHRPAHRASRLDGAAA